MAPIVQTGKRIPRGLFDQPGLYPLQPLDRVGTHGFVVIQNSDDRQHAYSGVQYRGHPGVVVSGIPPQKVHQQAGQNEDEKGD